MWDYSHAGEELGVAGSLRETLMSRVDECEYLVAVISPSSIDEVIGVNTRFEVRYAIDCGRLRGRILPVLLGSPPDVWKSVYPELTEVLWVDDFDWHEARPFEDASRRICQWLSVPYIPTSLKDPRVFFAELLLKEAESQPLSNSQFVQLFRTMNNCASALVEGDWKAVHRRSSAFVLMAEEIAPNARFHYPLVIRGVGELQLNKLNQAKATFLEAIKGHTVDTNPLLGLGYAGLGHTYYLLRDFDRSRGAFEKALSHLPQDRDEEFSRDVTFNLFGTLLENGTIHDYDSILDRFDLSKLSPENRRRILTMTAAAKYRKKDYSGTVETLGLIDVADLNEAAAVYRALALKELELFEEAIELLEVCADRINTPNLIHHLAEIHLMAGDVGNALTKFSDVLCHKSSRELWRRQYFIDYARILKYIGEREQLKKVCVKVLDPDCFPLPQTAEDFFYTGFAYYFLGDENAARHDHSRAASFCREYYAQLELP